LEEVVIGGIDPVAKSASYRICLFNSLQFNQGTGAKASKLVLKYCFEELGLNRIELEVYDFNRRAQRVYEKLGFVREGTKREALYFRDQYHDIITMAVLARDYFDMKGDGNEQQ
jgi:RimJ/RimL family protein N-acetyltransferase